MLAVLAVAPLSGRFAWAQDETSEDTTGVGTTGIQTTGVNTELFPNVGIQSPTAASLGKFGDIPVSLYTGAPDITIPLYEVEARTHSLPIRLRYHAAGIRVGELASWVGQNWALEAGGVVTRTLRGIPDEHPDVGFLNQGRDDLADFFQKHGSFIFNSFNGSPTGFDFEDGVYLQSLAESQKDAEPDEFFFNVAGLSGHFVFNDDAAAGEQIVITSRGQPVKIEYSVSGGRIQQWTLWGPDGTRYVFAQPELTAASFLNYEYHSSWHLTSIHPPSGDGDAIHLGYIEDGNWITYASGAAETWKNPIQGHIYPSECPTSLVPSLLSTNHTYKPKYLSYIESDRVRVEFISQTGRQDIIGERSLSEIQVKRGSTLLKKFILTHGYYNDGTNTARLRLDKVQEVGPSGASVPPYEFVYNSTSLPGYGSLSIDHWGFYNGGSSGLIPQIEFDGNIYPGNTSRDPSPGHSKAGILTKIVYPTGGHTEFTYELHDYGDINGSSGSGSAGGLRIQTVESDAGDGSPVVLKRYEYELADGTSSGVLVAEPLYFKNQTYLKCNNTNTSLISCPYLYRTSSSLAALGTASGGHIGYRQVQVFTQSGTTQNRAEHEFATLKQASHPYTPDQNWPRVPRPSMGWNHGHQVSSSFYDEYDRLLRKISFVYQTDADGVYPEVRALRVNQAGEGDLPEPGLQCISNYRVNDYEVQAGWRRLTSKTTTEYNLDGTVALDVTENYMYDSDNFQVTTVTETTPTATRVTDHDFAFQQYTGMENAHMLVQRYATTVTDGAGTPAAKRWTKWKYDDSDGDGTSHWRPTAEWTWIGDGSGNDTSAPSNPGGSETIRRTKFLSYTPYGQVLAQMDARGNQLTRTYDGSNLFLQSVSKGGVTMNYNYYTGFSDDRWGLLQSIERPDGSTTTFDYDDLRRLETVKNNAGQLVSAHNYSFTSGNPGVDPSFVQTTAYGGASPNQITTEYVDGLGRPVQTRVEDGTNDVITAQTYDAEGRPHKDYRPYEVGGSGYDASFDANAEAHYKNLAFGSNRPFSETLYWNNPLDRVNKVHPPGEPNTAVQTVYGFESFDGTVHQFIETTDENGHPVRTYVDGFGRKIATVASPWNASTTRYDYDLQDNLTQVTRPKGDAVTYTYDRAGRLMERDSPDAGRTEYRYDAAGNLRFRQDANQRAAGTVHFTTYDALNRPLVTGVAPATFSNLDGEMSYAFESNQAHWKQVRAYDSAPSASSLPWNEYNWSFTLNNTEGRLAAEARRVQESGNKTWRLTFYSYNAEGQASKKHVFAPGLGHSSFRYAYNRQDRVTGRRLIAKGERFCQWYTYNVRGLVSAVYAQQSGSCSDKTRPNIAPEVTYTFTADGQVSSVDYHGNASPQVPYGYTIRGWVNAVDNVNSPNSAFAASYKYDERGAMYQADVKTQGLPSLRFYYALDGQWQIMEAGARFEWPAYNYNTWYMYDPNGNLTEMGRQDESNTLVDELTYNYTPGTNRLSSLTDNAGVHYNWDAGSGTFGYDANGNLTSTTAAPYALSNVTYDERNLPTSITTGGTTTTYRYSLGGQRTYKQSGTSDPEYYVLDGRTTLAVVTGSSLDYWNVTLPSGEVIGRHLNSGGRRYYLKDHLGSVRVVVDGSGTVKETRDYYPFGLPMPGRYSAASPPTKEDFTGHERDSETQLHYAGARYYMSALGRWTTTDPILNGDPRPLLEDQRQILLGTSPYNYSLNNPTNLRDPDGRCPVCWDIADIAFAVQSVNTAINDPSASNIGLAAVDVAAAALPLVPSTGLVRAGAEAAEQFAKRGADAIQSITAGVANSKRARKFAQASRALGRAANSAESIAGLKRVATRIEDIRGGLSVSLGAGSDASKIARNLVGEGANPASFRNGNVLVFSSVQLGEETATVVVRTPKASRTGTNTVEVQLSEETIKFRTQKLGSLFE